MNSKLVILITIATIISGSTLLLVLADEDKPGNSVNNNKMNEKGLPQSLDQYYTEPEYPGMPFEVSISNLMVNWKNTIIPYCELQHQ